FLVKKTLTILNSFSFTPSSSRLRHAAIIHHQRNHHQINRTCMHRWTRYIWYQSRLIYWENLAFQGTTELVIQSHGF
ncbi:hypothetical protein LINGRAHAP2_LOCUS10564, partial [Linum grandiflorum]